MQVLKEWAPALALFIALGGLQITLHNSLSGRIDRLDTRIDNLSSELADVRERLARVEAKLGLPVANAIVPD